MKAIPTISELYKSISNDLKNKLDLNDDKLKKVLDAFASVTAAQMKLLYLFLADIQNNVFPDTADTSENGGTLEQLGLIYLNRQPNPATAGVYTAKVIGENNSEIRENLTFKSNDDAKSTGYLFVTDSESVLTGVNDFIEIRSLEAGLNALLEVGNQLTITEPVIGVDKTIEITQIIEEPKSAESIDDYRNAILNAIQLEPQGGARTDYRLWSEDAQGVREVYPYVKDNEAGIVQIYIEATEEDSIDGFGTPSAALLQNVNDVIEFDPDITKPLNERGRRPIQAIIECLPIVLIPVDIEVIGLNINTSAIQQNIEDNLKITLQNIRPFIAGADLERNKNDILYSAKLQSIVSDVLDVSNFFTNFVLSVNGNNVNSFTFSRQNIPYLRNVIYS